MQHAFGYFLRSTFILTSILMGLCLPTSTIQAATIDVPCSAAALIAAITNANTNPGDDTLNLAAGCTYSLTAVNNIDPFYGPNGLPAITSPITLNGSGATIQRNAAAADFRIFYVATGGNLTLNNVTISGGHLLSFDGGGIFNIRGAVTLNSSTISGNSANYQGGGIDNAVGTMVINSSTISGNSISFASGGGGGIFNGGTMTITASTISGNTAPNGGGSIGGGIVNYGMLTISGSTISGNSAGGQGGGIYSRGPATISSSTISDNTVAGLGGGIYNYDTMTISGCTFSGNQSLIVGGGYYNRGTATISGCTFSGNSAPNGDGAAIYAYDGSLTITGSVITGNTGFRGTAWTIRGGTINSLSGSCIFNNTTTDTLYSDVHNSTVTTFSVVNNWWGSPDGPGTAGGDTVSSRLTYIPFLTAPAAPCAAPAAPSVSTAPSGPSAADQARAQAPLCGDLNGTTSPIVRADVPGGTVPNGGVYCRIINESGTYRSSAAEIGSQAVLDRGVLQAVDVFGQAGTTPVPHFSRSVRVCLQGSGPLLFLDALTSPRALSQLLATQEDGYTCATIPNAGTVVLVGG